jgi:hypothetical protein
LNTDGSPLTDLAGYTVFYSHTPTVFGWDTLQVKLTDPAATRFVLQPLASGTWYFAVTAFNTQGVQSAPSNTGVKVIP